MLERIREISSERAQKLNRVGDVALLGAAASAASLHDGAFHWLRAIALFAAGATVWSLGSRIVRQYDAENGRGFFGDVALTMATVVALGLPLTLVSTVLPRALPPLETARFLALLVPAILVLRLSLVGLELWRSRPVADVIIAGVGPLGRLTGAEMSEGWARRRVIGYLSFGHEKTSGLLPAPLLGGVHDLERTLREVVVDEVYFASTAAEHSREAQAAIHTCEKLGVPFALPACAYRLTRARPTSEAAVADGYAHFTTVHVTPLEQAAKRAFDIVVSAAALVIVSPVMLAAAILVKLTSPGPVLFRQERVGLMGRRFQMLKFRSMVANAEALKASLLAKNEQSGPVFKIKHDPRVTPVGRFLRKYSIDELPQIVNVLRGDMSIVGPRPPLPSEVARYEAWQRRRLSVRPGLTCVWQVMGRSEISFQDWMLLDMRYIDHWSFTRDVGLVLRTVPVVLRGRGAS
jgi:exopolysaccharide biosynthesis polyprenyl glycosylphosphotransferase